YVDHAHPEYSSPECSNPIDAVVWDKAGERILEDSIEAMAATFPESDRILIYKNNSDGKGNSYGCHENYLVDRAVPFSVLVKHLMPFFVTRQVFAGAGKVGSENGVEDVEYQISQRADFFEVEVGLETTFKRPIINTRDEPHADPERYRRLHVIVGDANMAELPIFLKMGTTSLLLEMIEDDFIRDDFSLSEPVAAIRRVSHDPSCRATIELQDGRTITAVELQWEYFRLAAKYVEDTGAGEPRQRVLAEWERVLSGLESDPFTLAGDLDWVAKLGVLRAYKERDGLDWSAPKLRLVDLQYHDVRRKKGLYWRLLHNGKMNRLVEPGRIEHAIDHPPEDTRAYFRGECLRRFSDDIVAASWDALIFDTGTEPLRKVPTLEPTRGTRAHVEGLFAASPDVATLIANLSA
ncbi:MAG TPA: depupylase/deamidase Dop, partial [Actinomycetota bacterium]|nr:depupylase/deamidase Dop [Actinomycetota bacterium]